MFTELIGYSAGALSLLALVPYIRDIFRDKTKPERASWLIWSILDFIAFFSQFAKGASHSLFMTVGFAIGDFGVFLLSLKYGYGNKLLKRDVVALAGAGVGLLLWYLTQEAAIALFLVIVVDAIGGVLTIIKSYESPSTETVSKWVMTSISAALASIAVGSFNPVLLAFPVFIFFQNFAIAAAILLGRRRSKVSNEFSG